MPPTQSAQDVNCSFCAKSQLDVVRLVAGPGVYICNECVDLCNQIITQDLERRGQEDESSPSDVPAAVKAWEELSDDDLLAEMVRAHGAHENVDRSVARHVAELRARGVSWARIGVALGMTRQSAWERFS